LRYCYLLLIALTLGSCGESSEEKIANQKVEAFKNENAKETPKENATVIEQESDAKKESQDEGFMKKIGLETNGSIITLDTNKTKGYINELGSNLKEKSIELSKDIKEGTLKATKEIGIEMNTTKDFVSDMGKKMENIAQDVNKFTRSITKEQNTTH